MKPSPATDIRTPQRAEHVAAHRRGRRTARPRAIAAADLFSGAGGSSTGLAQACSQLGLDLQLLAVNHWDIALRTHSANHPGAAHLCASLDNIDPKAVVPSGRLNLLIASPECTHHSIARGGKPVNDQSRSSAWHILRWAEALYVDSILIENVREFQTWGPIGANGHPLRSLKGATFLSFLKALESLGYNVDYKVLNAADYGDATTRERLFIQARRGRKRIVWPEPTHAQNPLPDLFGGEPKPWRTAREIIDWTIPSQSIFTRKKPLAPATIARIAAGIRKFSGCNAEPFLVILRHNMDAKSLDRPIPTITTSGAHLALCEPLIVPQLGEREGQTPPMRSIDPTLPTVTGPRTLVEPFLFSMEHGCKTLPFVIPTNHGAGDSRSHSIANPMPTVTTVDAWALVEPFLLKYNGTARAYSIDDPIDTITAKDCFGLIESHGCRLDIRFRMLQPRELAAAMGFPGEYQFSGNREDRVKQIGNAVPVNLAQALCRALLEQTLELAA